MGLPRSAGVSPYVSVQENETSSMAANPTATIELAEAERRLSQLKARQERLDARLRYLASSRARKDETRRKILAGAILRAKVEAGEFDSRTFKRWMDKALTRKDDRELFELPEK
jgi:hypothetical protein